MVLEHLLPLQSGCALHLVLRACVARLLHELSSCTLSSQLWRAAGSFFCSAIHQPTCASSISSGSGPSSRRTLWNFLTSKREPSSMRAFEQSSLIFNSPIL